MLIPLSQLFAHPHNANVMPEALLAKLAAHIRATGRYPPLIVRRMGASDDRQNPIGPDRPIDVGDQQQAADARYQILDGHHRALALRHLGHAHARCEVWENVDDQQADMLLLTLNRLQGEDDPFKRGELIARLSLAAPLAELARLLPDPPERIERLKALAAPRLDPVPAPKDLEEPPRAITFFIEAPAYPLLLKRLREIDPDRTHALLKALGVDHAGTTPRGAQPQASPANGQSS